MLSPERAFVIHMDSSTNLANQQPVGKVEHILSGDSIHFRSLTDLLSFLERHFHVPSDAR